MKEVAIFQFSPTEGPGHLADFLDRKGIARRLIRMDDGGVVPASSTDLAGIVMMGGPMSVNDPLPWIPPLLALIRHAVDNDVPLLGHCLGGQFIAKALGGEVTNNKCREMGWHAVDVVGGASAVPWFGDVQDFTTFQWHYQTFSIPPGAVRVLRNEYCENQAFALGPHIGFQCHIEMTAEMVKTWCASSAEEIAAAGGTPSVQSVAEVLSDLDARVGRLNRLADNVYTHWVNGLKKD
jgi:GMP synthase-like glutamine amidotransferase